MKYTVTVPVKVIGLQDRTSMESRSFVSMITEKAISDGATYMDFKIVNEIAVFESDSEQFAKELYGLHVEIMIGLIDTLKNSVVYKVSKT